MGYLMEFKLLIRDRRPLKNLVSNSKFKFAIDVPVNLGPMMCW